MATRSGASASQRQLRVAESLRHQLAEILARGDFRDPALQRRAITVTEVRISPDLKNATAFVMPLGGETADDIVEALERASGYLRSQVGRQSSLRYTPRLSFALDGSFDEADRIGALLRRERVRQDLDSEDDEAGPQDTESSSG